jgi:hypothetical protein
VEHDLVLTRKDRSTTRFRIYGRPKPKPGDVVSLPIGGRLIKARINEAHGSPGTERIQSIDHVEAAEI